MSSSYDSAVVDTAMIEDARLLQVTSRGIRHMQTEALVWSKLRRTDGFIPEAALTRLTDEPNPIEAAGELVRVGLWERGIGGWQIVNFLDTQMSADRVKRRQESARKRYDAWQESQSEKRVSKRVSNGAARPPARKGGRVEDAPSGRGRPTGARCGVCGVELFEPLDEDDEAHIGDWDPRGDPRCYDCA